MLLRKGEPQPKNNTGLPDYPETDIISTWKWMIGKRGSFWEGLFSGAISVSGKATTPLFRTRTANKKATQKKTCLKQNPERNGWIYLKGTSQTGGELVAMSSYEFLCVPRTRNLHMRTPQYRRHWCRAWDWIWSVEFLPLFARKTWTSQVVRILFLSTSITKMILFLLLEFYTNNWNPTFSINKCIFTGVHRLFSNGPSA